MKIVVSLLLLLCGCTPKLPPQSEPLSLVVAASAAPAALNFAATIEASKGWTIRVHSGASSLVARQIAGGLPCDVVILADDEWMDFLATRKLIESSTRRPFLGNRLVWIANNSPLKVRDEANSVAIADPEHVPAGKYAKAALLSLGEWDKLASHVVPAPDARTALLWVERGEVDRGIVYESDALSSKRVKIVSHIAENANLPIRYPIAQCRSKNARARELLRQLTQNNSLDIFRAFGFQIVKSAHEPV